MAGVALKGAVFAAMAALVVSVLPAAHADRAPSEIPIYPMRIYGYWRAARSSPPPMMRRWISLVPS